MDTTDNREIVDAFMHNGVLYLERRCPECEKPFKVSLRHPGFQKCGECATKGTVWITHEEWKRRKRRRWWVRFTAEACFVVILAFPVAWLWNRYPNSVLWGSCAVYMLFGTARRFLIDPFLPDDK